MHEPPGYSHRGILKMLRSARSLRCLDSRTVEDVEAVLTWKSWSLLRIENDHQYRKTHCHIDMQTWIVNIYTWFHMTMNNYTHLSYYIWHIPAFLHSGILEKLPGGFRGQMIWAQVSERSPIRRTRWWTIGCHGFIRQVVVKTTYSLVDCRFLHFSLAADELYPKWRSLLEATPLD